MSTDFWSIQLASEADRKKVLVTIRGLLKPGQIVFVGVIDPINPTVESPEQVRDRVLEAVEFVPRESLGTTDDCGFSSVCRRYVDVAGNCLRENTDQSRGDEAGVGIAQGLVLG